MTDKVNGDGKNRVNGADGKQGIQQQRPVRISKADNEWNKRALEIAARELRLPKTPVPAR
jgi:hypothetical protein